MEEVELPRSNHPAMTFDEVSLERSKSFVKALQELKGIRPQLYSAAEYCEKSYLHSEQKQMVLDNLKDYAVRALVNVVDHLGTVAYKLTDLLEQQTLEVSTMELKASCLNHQLLTCQTYMGKEGCRQQHVLAFIPRHHKHYILPNSVNKKVHFSPQVQTDYKQNYFQAFPLQSSDTSSPKPLAWHLASESKRSLKGTSETLSRNEISKHLGNASELFQLFPGSHALVPSLAIMHREPEGSKPLTAFKSFDNRKRQIIRAPVKSKSLISAFFVKQKTLKLKATYVS